MSDYTTMISDIINWTNHDEITTANAASLIRYAEKKIYRRCRVSSMVSTLSVTISGGEAALPSDFIELRHVRVAGSPDQPLGIVSDEEILRKYPNRTAESKPLFCGVKGTSLIFGPYPDTTYTIKGSYFARLSALSTSNTTNFFTGDGSDALFYQALAEAEPFLRNDPRVALWEAKAEQAIMGINKEYKMSRHAGPKRTKEA